MKRILLVEDHSAFGDALFGLLGREPDFEVVARAASMAEARTFYKRYGCDVAIVDILLPDGDGTKLIRELWQANPRVSILVLTVVPEHVRLAGVEEMGAVNVLSKEASLSEIFDALRAFRD